MNTVEVKASSSRVRKCQNWSEKNLLFLDQFGESFTMKIDDTQDTIRTFMGLFCSIILIAIVSSFAYQKTDIWLKMKDVDILSSTHKHHFDSDYVFSSEMGLNFAVAFTKYDSETEDVLHASYGSLVFSTFEWGVDAQGKPITRFNEIQSHSCSKEELGLEGQE